jgi:hypothetical protein
MIHNDLLLIHVLTCAAVANSISKHYKCAAKGTQPVINRTISTCGSLDVPSLPSLIIEEQWPPSATKDLSSSFVSK